MEKFERVLRAVFYPPVALRVILMVVGFGSLIPAFFSPLADTPFAYISYILSAYAMLVAVVGAIKICGKMKEIKNRLVQENALANRYVTDHYFRVSVSLCVALVVNLGYAVLKATGAVLYASAWTGAIAAYYIALCAVRFYLMKKFINAKEKDEEKERISYRNTAVFLFFVNLALAAIVYKVVQDGETYSYPGYIIYVYAGYTFYSFCSSIYNMVKYRRFHSPLLSASKAIGMTAALVSVISLQTAMLTQFGTKGDFSRRLANALTGTAVCVAALSISIFMLVQSKRKTR
ncbi:hypothetical protein [Murimonas intestini]|uniref:hypothetical protein n=1 Tax=Murimonas intestini TaxID=1337051 RepID=UPI0011DE57DE|nr:hypothetical protein [Murimonas intestini]